MSVLLSASFTEMENEEKGEEDGEELKIFKKRKFDSSNSTPPTTSCKTTTKTAITTSAPLKSRVLQVKGAESSEIDFDKVHNYQFELNKKNQNADRDGRIFMLESSHHYYIDGHHEIISVSCTPTIHSYFETFDSEKIVNGIVKNKRHSSDVSYKYYQKTKEAILQDWEENRSSAAALGTSLHARIERFYNGYTVEEDDKEMGIEFNEYFQRFHRDIVQQRKWTIYRTEHMIFIEELYLNGSIDAIFKNEKGEIILVDWKRSKKIEREGFQGKMGTGICSDLPDCNFYHYSLQLNLYKYILELKYNMKVSELYLAVFHPDNENDSYILIPVSTSYTQSHILPIIEERRLYVEAWKEGRVVVEEKKVQVELLQDKD